MGVCAGLVAAVVSLIGVHAFVPAPSSTAAFAVQSGTTAAMTNEDVIRMAKAGLAEDVIITAIRQAPKRNFELGASGLIELKLGKVPDAIVRAMQALEPPKTSEPASPPPPVTLPPPAAPAVSARRLPAVPMPHAPPPAPVPARQSPRRRLPCRRRRRNLARGRIVFVTATGGLTALERVRLRKAEADGRGRSRTSSSTSKALRRRWSSGPANLRASPSA
jgi:hypothetical protein